ncbi:cupin domain-containing protein [Anaerotaenia torta]|uniref:cupin domain-containing protein n=1 Tax=Anaerotaenia torta TaxID=433293 RepID=UPI003D1CFBFE
MKGMIHMYNGPAYPCPYCGNIPMHAAYNMYQYPYSTNTPIYNLNLRSQFPDQSLPYVEQAQAGNPIVLNDYGPNPFVVNIEEATEQNRNFRTSLWTGYYLQLTLMSINVGEDIGLEIHPDLDQFIRIEEGQGFVRMGDRQDNLDFQAYVRDDFAIIIPAGKWHNLFNTGNTPLKLYSIYAPPQHPFATVHETKEDAEEDHTR